MKKHIIYFIPFFIIFGSPWFHKLAFLNFQATGLESNSPDHIHGWVLFLTIISICISLIIYGIRKSKSN